MAAPNTRTPLVAKGGAVDADAAASGGGYRDPALERVRAQVDQARGVVQQNVDLAIERTGDLQALDDKSRQLEADSRVFKHRSGQLRRRFCMSYYRTMFVIFLIVAAIIAIIVFFATKK